jgi:hypothetical protein
VARKVLYVRLEDIAATAIRAGGCDVPVETMGIVSGEAGKSRPTNKGGLECAN